MYSRHDEVPVYAYRESQLDAAFYNHVQLAHKRIGKELRLTIPGLKTLDLILQHDAWIIVDRAFNDVPVVAWVDFKVSTRSNLHEPISCSIRLYHANGMMVMRRVLESMDKQLLAQLDAGTHSHKVLNFPGKAD